MMKRKNPFDGDSYYALFARVTYKRFISRGWVTHADVMAEFRGLNSSEELPCGVSKCDGNGELKKAFSDIRNKIIERLGCESFLEEGTKNKRIRYIGKDDDPLADLRTAKVISDLKQYWQFCQDSAGFFPITWLDYFFKDSRDLLEIKDTQNRGQQILEASEDRNLTNIELLPFLYEAIKRKQVLAIYYIHYTDSIKEELSLIVSPHYLKEFNGRWYLLGHTINNEGKVWRSHIALDRIVARPREISSGVTYVEPQAHYYENYFKNIVGVTHPINAEVINVHIRAHNHYMFMLTETKKIHLSQKVEIPFGKYTDGTYGEFSVQVEVNDEFVGRILQMGAGLEIVSPQNVREKFKRRVEALADLYKKQSLTIRIGSFLLGTNSFSFFLARFEKFAYLCSAIPIKGSATVFDILRIYSEWWASLDI